jgi:ligand-binding sensor domain-containing protein
MSFSHSFFGPIRAICTLLWFSLWLSSLPAQVYNVTRYSTDDGLVQSQVMALLQDRWGYLWLGTHRGAAKFDGKQFYVIGTEEGLSSTFLADLAEDPAGGIWMATDDGLSYWNGTGFTNFHRKDGLPDNDIQCLHFDRDSNLWIGTRSQGVARYRQGRFDRPLAQPDTNASVQALLEDTQGRLWVGTLHGLMLSEPDKQGLRPMALPSSARSTPAEVHALLEDRTGRIWIGTTQGVWTYHGDEGLQHHPLDDPTLPSRAVFCLTEDRDGQIWLGTGNGLIRYHAGTFTPLQRGDRLLAYRMASACVDYEGSLWFGTDGGGVRKITEGIFQSYGMKDKLTSNLAKSFLQDERGRIWISTKDRGINLFDQGRIVSQYTVQKGLGGDDICSSYEDQAGDFWFASYNGTLTRYTEGGFQVYDRDDGLACNAVYWVTQDPQGQLYVCTDNGIFRWQRNQRFVPYLNRDRGLFDNTVYTLLIDHKQRFWIGTSAGLMVGRPDSLISYVASEVVGNNVITLLEDPIGRIWVGSSVGLTCFSAGQPEQVRISGAPGAHTVVGLVMEKTHYLWIGTENGAYRLELESYQAGQRPRFDHYTQKDGLPSLECNANAAFADAQGDIWLGTAEGAIHRPASTERREVEVQPRVYITQVRAVADQSWTALGYAVNPLGLPEDLVLPYTENRVDFTYIGISLRSPQQVEYRFMMEGVDETWLRPTRQTSVFYPNLDPGQYTFKVMAKKESETWDEENYAAFQFAIRPPFWRTWWFVTLMSLLVLGSGYAIYQSYAQRRRRQREQLRLQNAAEKLQLEHQALYAMMNPHFTFNALQSIQYFIHRQDRKSANKFLSSFAKLVRKNLESTKVDFISLSEEVDRLKLYLSLEKMRFPEKFDYEVTLDYGSDLGEVQLPPMLLQPFVENSIKHGIMPLEQDGMIHIDISQIDADYLRIMIQDNGIGLSASQARRANRPNDHVSKGMQITKDRLALFARITGKQYSLDIRELHDADGKVSGTMVEIVLPIRQEVMLGG